MLDTGWTGCAIFQITGRTHREMGIFANLPAQKLGREAKIKIAQQHKGGVNGRHLCAADTNFQEAKHKNLESFFDNQVWECLTRVHRSN